MIKSVYINPFNKSIVFFSVCDKHTEKSKAQELLDSSFAKKLYSHIEDYTNYDLKERHDRLVKIKRDYEFEYYDYVIIEKGWYL